MAPTSPNYHQEFQYNTLDPSTPIEIEEYSDLYDDYLDSPDSQSNATMNSGAAVYEQSVTPSEEDLHNILQPSILNNRNHDYVSDDSLDSSFGNNNNNNNNNISNYDNSNFISNNNSNISFKTPQFSNISRFGSPRTPIANIVTPKILNNSNKYSGYSPINNNNNNTNDSLPSLEDITNSCASPLGIVSPVNKTVDYDTYGDDDITNNTTTNNSTGNHTQDNSGYYNIDDDDDDEQVYQDVSEETTDDAEREVINYEEEKEEEEEEEEDYDDDDDYDNSEVERLRMEARQKNQQIYASYNNSNNSDINNTNDATIITKIPGQSVKTIRKGINDFQLGKELGEGSYSTVVLGIDIQTKKKYAIKILNKRHIIKEKKVKYVNIEKNSLNRLGKRNGIIGLHFTFQDSQSLYFVLDFAANGELLSLIKRFGTMNEDCTKHYTVQLIDAIDYMHKNGIIHRDLKPENILLSKDMKLQITDFGTAKILEKDDAGNYPRDARANSFVGTAEYVSPELLNDKYCGKPADIWAFGCIVYQMIAGKPPFKATNEYLTFQKVQKLQYAFTAGFPIVIRDLIKRILLIKPRERLTLFDIKNHLWFDDINWNNQNQIWNTPPPILTPYKISAKAMKSRPELDLQYPNGSSSSVQNVKKMAASKSNSIKKPKQTNNSKTGLSNIANTNNNSTNNTNNMRSVSSASAPASVQNSQSTPKTIPRKKKSASSAAAVALYGNRKGSTSTQGSTSITTTTTNTPAKTSPVMHYNHHLPSYQSSSELKQITADKIIKSKQLKTKETTSRDHINKSKFSTADVIPGTNIPRPVLNTKIPSSRSNTTTKSRNNSSLKVPKKVKVSQLSVLDMKWIQYLKHPDERIMKVGIVEAIREKSSTFEKKYKGLIIESPLGYKNKDYVNQPHLFSNNDDESIRCMDMVFNGSEPEINDDESLDSDPENESSVTKFKKFFTVKQVAPQPENKFATRTMLVTTFGRVLLFHENYGVDNKLKYELTTEIDLSNSLIHFVEVVMDIKNKSDIGLFAIMSNTLTIGFEVERTEVTQWTQCLANSRMMEKERRLRNYTNGIPDPFDEETAFAAASIAAVKSRSRSPEPITQPSISSTLNNNASSFPNTLRLPSEEHQSNHSSTTSTNRRILSASEKKIITSDPMMISAAVSKAVSMASPNAAVGIKNDKKITSLNSKFLARSRMK